MNNPWFPFYPRDFWADEAVLLMNHRQIGMYLQILSHDWTEDSLPADWTLVARIVRVAEDDKEFRQLVALIEDKYVHDTKGRMSHSKLEEIRDQAKFIQAKRIESSKRGGAATKKKWKAETRPNGQPSGPFTEGRDQAQSQSQSQSQLGLKGIPASGDPSFDSDGFLIIPDHLVDKWSREYTNLDVRLEISKASNDNNAAAPSDRKKDALRYMVKWLNRVSGWKKNDRTAAARPQTAAEANAERARHLIEKRKGLSE